VSSPAVRTQPVSAEAGITVRRAALQARCEQQREELAQQVGEIESRLYGTDAALGSIRAVLTKPTVLAGGLALLLTFGRSGWWSTLSRGAVLFAAGRRIYNLIRHK
jgi:hypothetical protein